MTNADSSTIPYLKELEVLAKEECNERKLDNNDMLFIAVAWVVLPAF